MKLSLKLAFLNIRRYPLRTLRSALCLLIFGFTLFSAVTFTRALNNTVSEALKSRSSGNTVIVKRDAEELDYISKNPDILETRVFYSHNYVFGNFDIEGVGEFDEIDLSYNMAPDIETLIPNTYFEEFHAISDTDFLVVGRMPENHGEMLINEQWLKSRHFTDYSVVLDKPITIYEEYYGIEAKKLETKNYFENARIVGVYSDEFLNITALHNNKEYSEQYQWCIAFLINSESKAVGVEAYCSIDKIDRVYANFCAKYGEENVIKTVLTVPAIERLSGFNAFIGNLMYLAAGACALIYVIIRVISASNYLKEKSLFVTAADAFGCSKSRILGAFTAENIMIMIPISVISATLGVTFVKLILGLISTYLGMKFEVMIDWGGMPAVLALMLIVEILTLIISVIIPRKNENN